MLGFDERLLEVLVEAQRRGFIGPGPLQPHVARSHGFAEAVGGDAVAHAVDLGSGGGLPGLVLAGDWPTTRLRLLDANQRRARFLGWAVGWLGLAERVVVDRRRAEEVGRDAERRGQADVVVARAFGRPAVTAECAAPLLREGGLLVVGEPPKGGAERWDVAGLEGLGLTFDEMQVPGFVRIRQAVACPERFPRRVGIPAKRPLF